MKIEISDIGNDIWIEEVQRLIEEKYGIKMNAVGNSLVAIADNAKIKALLDEDYAIMVKKWCEEIFNHDFNWE